MNTLSKIFLAIASLWIWMACTDTYKLGNAPDASSIQYTVKDLGKNKYQFVNTTPNTIGNWTLHNTAVLSGSEVEVYLPFKGTYEGVLTVYGKGGTASAKITYTVTADDPDYIDEGMFLSGKEPAGHKVWKWNHQVDGWYKVTDVNNFSQIYYAAAANAQDSRLFDDELIFYNDGRYELNDQGYTVINWSWYEEVTGIPDKDKYSDTAGPTAAYHAKLGNKYTWSIVTENNKKYLKISNGGWLSFFNGSSKYEITKISATELTVVSIYHDGPNTVGSADSNGHEFNFILSK